MHAKKHQDKTGSQLGPMPAGGFQMKIDSAWLTQHNQKQQSRQAPSNRKGHIYCRTTNENPIAIEAQQGCCADLCRREKLVVVDAFSDANVPDFTVGPALGKLIRACQVTGREVRHLVLYPTIDSEWIIHTLVEAATSPALVREQSKDKE